VSHCSVRSTATRNSGAKRTTPLIYQRHGHDYLVVASNGGGDPPGWFLNLQDDPIVAVQVKADREIPVVVLEPG
jgi:deazaflavin-dependent oxidoreductase (nitroreductase family)